MFRNVFFLFILLSVSFSLKIEKSQQTPSSEAKTLCVQTGEYKNSSDFGNLMLVYRTCKDKLVYSCTVQGVPQNQKKCCEAKKLNQKHACKSKRTNHLLIRAIGSSQGVSVEEIWGADDNSAQFAVGNAKNLLDDPAGKCNEKLWVQNSEHGNCGWIRIDFAGKPKGCAKVFCEHH